MEPTGANQVGHCSGGKGSGNLQVLGNRHLNRTLRQFRSLAGGFKEFNTKQKLQKMKHIKIHVYFSKNLKY